MKISNLGIWKVLISNIAFNFGFFCIFTLIEEKVLRKESEQKARMVSSTQGVSS